MGERKYKVAVVGATGVVGREMLRVLAERQFPVSEVVALASAKSAGQKLPFGSGEVTVQELKPEAFNGVEFALFSAGSSVSKEFGPIAASKGAIVIDNSSAWRMDPQVPLCVPEVNLDAARVRPKGIIANPNCSTIQMMVALKPLHDAAKIKRIVVSTYQAVSGAGAPALKALEEQLHAVVKGDAIDRTVLKGQLAGNLLMHWKVDPQSLYQEEELKMINETRKILGDESIRVSPTTVRVSVHTGHSESVAIETEKPLTAAKVRELLAKAPGVVLMDDFANGLYPTPLHAHGKDEVFVGRIREDLGNPGGILMWIVGDNLRKGAATNAIQIAEGLIAS